MWSLDNRTPFAAERALVRDARGVPHWIVAVRGTFALASDGALTLSEAQPPPVLAPRFYGEPGASSLQYETDLCLLRPTTDVTVLGDVHAPQGQPAASVRVALRVGSIFDKELLVHGDRVYREDGVGAATTRPLPFVQKPLRYEEAFGGVDESAPTDATDPPTRPRVDARNPVGRGLRRRRGAPAHSIEYPDGDPAQRGPAGFGPVASQWLPRRALAGTFDARWYENKRPLLPDDYDPRFAQCAPADQRPTEPLRGGERVELVGMTPEGVLRLTLPRVALTFVTRFGTRREEHDGRLVSVVIEPAQQRLSLVWSTALRVPAFRVEQLDETVIEAPRAHG